MQLDAATIRKFDVPGPRYTSYPTAPEWRDQITDADYADLLGRFDRSSRPLSMYVHIPFCKTLCWYCGCNTIIKKKTSFAEPYLDALFCEIDSVAAKFTGKKQVIQLHWGGGTPTFLEPLQIRRLFTKLADTFRIDPRGEVAVEVDPRTVDDEKLRLLRELGFNRVSFGVQDTNPEVLRSVNRDQPFDEVEKRFRLCRELGFSSVNMDLIYGLPFQSADSFAESVRQICRLKPDRIALYSFAHLPARMPHQRLLKPETMPGPEEKIAIFLRAREVFLESGYRSVGMDHFALETDEMCRAREEGGLYRNFMGYTLKPADDFLGFGTSAIGQVEGTFVQNTKDWETYRKAVTEGSFAIERGKFLDDDDRIRQWVILALMCRGSVSKPEFSERFGADFDAYFEAERDFTASCAADGLLENSPESLTLTALGRLFVRNVCMGFDRYLRERKTEVTFSRTV